MWSMSEPTNPINSVPSPCVSLCKMDVERQYCMGCLRTIDEIIDWGGASEDHKRAVWAAIRRREAQIDFQ